MYMYDIYVYIHIYMYICIYACLIVARFLGSTVSNFLMRSLAPCVCVLEGGEGGNLQIKNNSRVLQCVAVACVAVNCSVLQCVAVCCSGY